MLVLRVQLLYPTEESSFLTTAQHCYQMRVQYSLLCVHGTGR
uniref:Uncharacterized protein n=1 Tax=Anguilla anguilla TaxID=7936 RepID=A0A0E9T989_ANGAN